jgi:hypothetical protein
MRLIDPRYNPPNHGVLADSAFPVSGLLRVKIMTPLKDDELERAPIELQRGLSLKSGEITSQRQAAEWRMGAVPKVYKQLMLPLPFNQKVRARRILNIHKLYNYRVRKIGISQIRSYFNGC